MSFDTIQVTKYEQNCSIVHCAVTGKAAAIDPGGDVPMILDLLAWEGLALEVILVTHGHFDHCGAAAELAAATGARIEGPHRGDAPLIAVLADRARIRGCRARSFEPARWLEHGDVVTFGAQRLEVLHCPGHTRGHVAYFDPAQRTAWVGDILFRGAIGAWEHADGDLRQLVDSIRTRLFPLGDDVVFVPGHGETSTFGHERRESPFVGDAAMELWEARGSPMPPVTGATDPAIE